MKKAIIATCLLLCSTLIHAESEWIDVTETYITNPSYDNNSLSGWLGTQLGQANPQENAEHYQKTYDTYQVLSSLPAGDYRLSLQAFYRMGSAYNDYTLYSSGSYSASQHAVLYATTETSESTVEIVPLSSAALSSSLGGSTLRVGSSSLYVPNDMAAANAWFNAGYYNNTLEFTVDAEGDVTIGIRKSELIQEDWTCIDNWKLEWYTEVKPVTALELSLAETTMVPLQQLQLSATITPSDATQPKLTWTSSNTDVATVTSSGLVEAVATGSAIITATSTDGSDISTSCTVTVVDAVAPTAQNIIINEIMAANVDVYRDPSTNFGSWVELYNPTDEGVSLGGLYVTDDISNLTKHQLVDYYGALGAHSFAMLNFDHREVGTKLAWRQIDDKLDTDGGTIIISDGTTVLAMQTYPAAIARTSYARTADGGSEWATAGDPTPLASNAGSTNWATEQLSAPTVSVPGQVFSSSFVTIVTIPDSTTLRYTTDGSTPTLDNGKTSTTGLFSVNATTVYRFRLFRDGYLPSQVVSRSYIKDSGNEPFPIISLIMEPQTFTGNDYSLFDYTSNGRPGNGQTLPFNGNMDWDRPVHFEYIDSETQQAVLSQECDLSATGGWSRAWSPHSFKLKATKTYYGLNSFDYQFFTEKPYLKHKTLQIRNGGNDYTTRIKDAALQQLVARSGMNVEYQSWQPVHVYINGEAYAVLNMREPNNKHYGYSNYGIDTDLMDQFEISPDSGYVQKEGTAEAYEKLYTLSASAADETTYNEIKKLLDIDQFVNYMAVELYLGTTDWPQNNVKAFRDQNDGKFRFVIFDLDGALSTEQPLTDFFGKETYTFDQLYGYDWSTGELLSGTRLTKQNKFVTIFKNLLANDDFRRRFIDAYCVVGGSVITPERANEVVWDVATTESQGNYVQPYWTATSIVNTLTESRQQTMINHLQQYSSMQLSSTNKQTFTLKSNIDGATIVINDQQVPTGEFSGTLFEPATVKAYAPAGYEFAGWAYDTDNASTTYTEIMPAASQWQYYDSGSLDAEQWQASDYSDTAWKTGTAPIGYGKTQTTTTSTNLPTYYFRKTISIDDNTDGYQYGLKFTVDDGAIVYINGTEVGRYNMPTGTVSYTTAASSYAPNNPDEGEITFDGSLLSTGDNVIAVEVHNNSTTSTDILWDASLVRYDTLDTDNTMASTETEYTLPMDNALQLIATWQKKDDSQLIASAAVPVKINEVSPANDMYVNEYIKKDDWVELYNTTNYDINLTGLYLSDNTEKPEKYQITASSGINTVLPANGYAIVWCSKRDAVSQLHASFKLSNTEGSIIMLSAGSDFVAANSDLYEAMPQLPQSFTDTLSYTAVNYDQTIGRFPDGANDYYVMNKATIGKANILQGSDVMMASDYTYYYNNIIGDVNNDGIVDLTDALLITQEWLGIRSQDTTFNQDAADVNGDGNITLADANAVMNIILGL